MQPGYDIEEGMELLAMPLHIWPDTPGDLHDSVVLALVRLHFGVWLQA